MTGEHQVQMSHLPRTHENCIKQTGVARPGKTRHDKATGAWAPKYVRRQRHIDRNKPKT